MNIIFAFTTARTVRAAGGTGRDIFAVDSNGKASAPSPTISVTPPTPPPPPPILPAPPVVSAVTATPDTITISWTESTPDKELEGLGRSMLLQLISTAT